MKSNPKKSQETMKPWQRKVLVIVGGVMVCLMGGTAVALTQAAHKPERPTLTSVSSQVNEISGTNATSQSQKAVVEATTTSSSTTPARDSQLSNQRQLEPGKNHSIAASDYAYSTQWVQEVMDGGQIHKGKRICFLTFDDGVNHEVTPAILDILKKEQVPATFFVVGNTIGEKTQALLKRQIAEGHSIALHSFFHDYTQLYPGNRADAQRIVQEAQAGQQALKEQLGAKFQTKVWRYPGGHMSWGNIDAADATLRDSGFHWVDWNAMSGDAEPTNRRPQTVEEMVNYQAQSITEYPDVRLRVVLMHDAVDKQLTVKALSGIIQFYREHDFTFGVLE